VDGCHAIVVSDNTNFQRLTRVGRADEHGDCFIVGLERSPVMSNCVDHVVVVDAMSSC